MIPINQVGFVLEGPLEGWYIKVQHNKAPKGLLVSHARNIAMDLTLVLDGVFPTAADVEGSRIVVNRQDLELGKAGQDVVLQDGDIINVPSAQHFYISGMVRNPGTFILNPGMTVQQAIALAGGLNDRGSDRRIKISRLVNGKLTEVSVELEDKIQAGDTLMISARFF